MQPLWFSWSSPPIGRPKESPLSRPNQGNLLAGYWPCYRLPSNNAFHLGLAAVRRNKKPRLMSELGHSLQIDKPGAPAQCPLHPNSGQHWRRSETSLSAKSRHSQCSKFSYSITSSASASKVDEGSISSALAVLRFITNSNLVGCIIGRSAGFSPFRMRPV